jgi:hypothetical protein
VVEEQKEEIMNRSQTHKSRHDKAVMHVNKGYPDHKGTRNMFAVGGAVALAVAVLAVILFYYLIVGV